MPTEPLQPSSEIVDNDTKLKLLAQGNTAEIYEYDHDKILKLFRPGIPPELIGSEYQKVKFISARLTNIPKVYNLATYKKRHGILYERIDGPNLIAAMLKSPVELKLYSQKLAKTHSAIHSHQIHLGYFVKDKLSADIEAASGLSEPDKAKIKYHLHSLPDGNSLLHFDFHPGNILLRNDRPIIIDWMTACTGDPCADIARTHLLLKYGELSHVNPVARKTARIFENYIDKIYLATYQEKYNVSTRDIEPWLLPVAAARLSEWTTNHERKRLLRLISILLAKQ